MCHSRVETSDVSSTVELTPAIFVECTKTDIIKTAIFF